MCHRVEVPRSHEKILQRFAASGRVGNGQTAHAKVSKRDLPRLALKLPDGLVVQIDKQNHEVAGSKFIPQT